MKKRFLSISTILSVLLCMSAAFAFPLSAEGEKTCSHSYGEWYLHKEGSEEEQGMYLRECILCHEKEERIIPCKSDPAIYGVLNEIDAEGNITVDIMIQNNPGFAGLKLIINYDSAILTPEPTVTTGEVLAGGYIANNVNQEECMIQLVVVSAKNFSKDGRIATVKFKAKEGAGSTVLGIRVDPNNSTNMDYNYITIYDKDLSLAADADHAHKYQWMEEAGLYHCKHYFCDVEYHDSADPDGDGQLTLLDGVLLLRCLLGGQEIEPQLADINQNGKAGLHDVIILLRTINNPI
ncbi:MAG: hypothetical protein IJN80_02825 [Clostridia bacterium]|nr:hypothetical protein [Clostridia bacterium]